jgi:hypothetical protein
MKYSKSSGLLQSGLYGQENYRAYTHRTHPLPLMWQRLIMKHNNNNNVGLLTSSGLCSLEGKKCPMYIGLGLPRHQPDSHPPMWQTLKPDLGTARLLRTGLGPESGIKPAYLYPRNKGECGNDESLRSLCFGCWTMLDLGPNCGCDCGCDLNESEAQMPILLKVSLIGNWDETALTDYCFARHQINRCLIHLFWGTIWKLWRRSPTANRLWRPRRLKPFFSSTTRSCNTSSIRL